LASGGVVAMEPIADGSTPGGQQAMAESAARAGTGQVGTGQSGTSLAGYDQPPAERRVIAAAMEPIADGSTPEGAAALAESANRQAMANSPTGPLARPVYTPSPARANGPNLAAASSPRRFGLIGSAQAASLPPEIRPVVANTSASWAVQVGAFSDERQARSAADAVGGGRVQVQPVRVGRSTLYRARVVGMTQGGAQQACGRVRGPCIVLSPDAQG
jgi:cell division septation protein DedD